MMKTKLQPIMRTALLLLALFASVISIFAHDFEVDGIYYLKNGTNATVTYKGSNYTSYSNEYSGIVSIPTTVTNNGTTYTVTSIGDDAFNTCSGLTSVTIPNSVTSIGSYAFYCCSGLTSITIPNFVTSIGSGAFNTCSGLTNVTIPNSVTTLGDFVFGDCSGLTSVIIPNSVSTISRGMFAGCSGLMSVNIPNSITTISQFAFQNCSGLTSVTIPNSVTSIGNSAFRNCSSLTSVTIPNSVTSIGSAAFLGTSWYNNQHDGLVYAGLVAYKYKGTMPAGTNIILKEGTLGIASGAFNYCSGLTSVTIPNSVITIGIEAFYGCSGLTSVTIPNSVTTIDDYAFGYCSGLTSANIPNSVNSISSNIFYYCTSLEDMIIEDGENQLNMNNEPFTECPIRNLRLGRDLVYNDGCSPFYGMTSLHEVIISNTVTTLGKDAFRNCSLLTDISFGKAVTSINNNAFSGCSPTKLTWNPKNCSSMGNMTVTNISQLTIGNEVERIPSNFVKGSKISEVTIPSSVKSISFGAFCNCSNLSKLTIRNGVLSIGEDAFRSCTGLSSITIPSSVTLIDYSAFCYCTSLTNFTIDDGKEQLRMSTASSYIPIFADCPIKTLYLGRNISYGSSPFYGMSTLNKLTIGDFVTEIGRDSFNSCNGLTNLTIGKAVKSIGESAFHACSALKVVTIPDSVLSLGYGVFYDCLGLMNVTIGNSVTEIGDYAFYNCSALTSATIGNSVNTIKRGAFRECKNLAKVYCKAAMPPMYESYDNLALFDDVTFQNAILYVPDLTYSYYKQSDPWKKFMDIKTEPYSDDGVVFNSTVYPTSIRMDGVPEGVSSTVNSHFTFENKDYRTLLVTGLEPMSIYSATYTPDGKSEIPLKFYTSALMMVAEGAKMLDETTAQLMAETNMADEETICGFDWRRYDGPDDYLGTRVYCPVYDGKMAGTLKNLSKETYYKYRPFYKSSAGNVYYGDWVTFYTADAGVEFDPVVYTYNSPAVTQTGATLEGVALRGSDEITAQGFEYWKSGSSSVTKVNATGERMSTSISGLQSGTKYMFRAFVTAGGKTIRGANVEFVTLSQSVDVNMDGEVNITDVNSVIDLIMTGGSNMGDVNGDGEVNIADINAIINAIINK